MERKVFNWLGWLLSIVYIAVIFLLIFSGRHMEHMNQISYRNYFYSGATLAVITSFAVIPQIFYLSLGKLLPYKQGIAKVLLKHEKTSETLIDGNRFTSVKQFITFEFMDGSRKVFSVSKTQYYSILKDEIGILTFKEQKKNLYFVRFEKQMSSS